MAESSEVVQASRAAALGIVVLELAGWLAGALVAEDKAGRRLLRGLGLGGLAGFDWLAARAECWEIKKYCCPLCCEGPSSVWSATRIWP